MLSAGHLQASLGVVTKPPIHAIVADFNQGRYRACVEPLEAHFFDGRSRGFKGLIQLSVALLQLERGLTKSPAYLLASSQRLMKEEGTSLAGIDLDQLIDQAHEVERWLSGGRVGPRPEVRITMPTQ
jgi:hypothetical protein